jgi:nitric oxide reductase NorQ protein
MTQVQVLDWQETEKVLAAARLALLFGPPGTGKTTAAVNAGRRTASGDFAAGKLPIYSVTLTDETPAAELRGHFVPTGERWEWMDGPALRAFRNGGMLVVNEIDHASGDALDFLHALLDDRSVAAITLPTGETVFGSESFRCVATMNGDLRQLEEDRPAIADRFAVAVYCGEPHPDAIAALPVDLRTAAANSSGREHGVERPATLRRWNAYASLREATGDEKLAGAAVFGHRSGEVLDALRLGAARHTFTALLDDATSTDEYVRLLDGTDAPTLARLIVEQLGEEDPS